MRASIIVKVTKMPPTQFGVQLLYLPVHLESNV